MTLIGVHVNLEFNVNALFNQIIIGSRQRPKLLKEDKFNF